jgi:CheY-like chemotaxis protein
MVLVALTGWGQEEYRRKAREAGFDVHLVKPVDPDTLMKLLASLPSDPDDRQPDGSEAP